MNLDSCLRLLKRGRHDEGLEHLGEHLDELASGGGELSAVQVEEVLAALGRVAQRDATDSRPHALSGWLLELTGRPREGLVLLERALELDPEEPFLWTRKACCLRALGQIPQALRCHKRALSLDPGEPDSWSECAHTQRMAGNLQKALEAYEQCLENDPALAQALVGRAECLLELGQPALEALQLALIVQPDRARSWVTLARSLREQKCPLAAAAAARRALALDGGIEEARAYLVAGEAAPGHAALLEEARANRPPVEAAGLLEKGLCQCPEEAWAWLELAGHRLTLGQPEAAAFACTCALALDPRLAVAWWRKARALENLSWLATEALKCCEEGLKLQPSEPEIWTGLQLAKARLLKVDAEKEAGKVIEEVLRRYPDHVEALVLRAECQYLEGKDSRALSGLKRALELQPDYVPAWELKATIYESLEQPEQRLACVERLLLLQPDEADHWFERVVCLEDLGRHSEVPPCCDRAMALRAEITEDTCNWHSCLWESKGKSLAALGDHRGALECLRQAAELYDDPFDIVTGEMWGRMACIHLDQKQSTQARDCAVEAQRRDPDSAFAWFVLGRLAEQEGRPGEASKAFKRLKKLAGEDPLARELWEESRGVAARG